MVTIVHLRGGWTSQAQFVKFANALWEPSGGEVYKRNVWIMKGVMAEFPLALNTLTSVLFTTLSLTREGGGWLDRTSVIALGTLCSLGGLGLISALASQIAAKSPAVHREKLGTSPRQGCGEES